MLVRSLQRSNGAYAGRRSCCTLLLHTEAASGLGGFADPRNTAAPTTTSIELGWASDWFLRLHGPTCLKHG